MNANEVAFGPLPGTVEAGRRALSHANRYPDKEFAELHLVLEKWLGLQSGEVIVGPGSIALCHQVAQSFCRAGDEVVFPWPSFEAYPLIANAVGAKAVPVPLQADASLDLAAIGAAVTARTRVIFLCSPNNPTGPALAAAATQHLIHRLPTNLVTVLDEAYAEFICRSDALDGLALLRETLSGHRNLLLMRTFSKAYGLAGMRVGYCAGPAELIELVRRASLPYAVSTAAQNMAVAALAAQDELKRRCSALVAERERVRSALMELGYYSPPSDANFCWLVLPDSADDFAMHCVTNRILVRSMAGHGVRITIGLPAENDLLLGAAANFGYRR